MGKNDFLKKLKALFIGKRPLKDRLLTALFPSLALSFILFLFGPLDLSRIAGSYVAYTVPDILPACLKVWGAAFAAMFLISWIAGGKLHVWLCSLFAGLAAAFYVQGNWLNIDLGALDGSAVEWQKYGDNALIGLVIFVLICLIPFLIRFFSRKVWKIWVIFTSALLLIMQAVPLCMNIVQAYRERPADEYHYRAAKDKEFTLGKENIVVFILDHFNPEHLAITLESYPDLLDGVRDFEYFDNFNTEYLGTFPAAAYLLTHEPYDTGIPASEWFEKAWHSDDSQSFYKQMREAGWTTRVFNEASYAAGDLKNEYGLIDNVEKVQGTPEFTIDRTVFRKLIKLSFYRYFPLIMKAPFRIYTGDLNGMKILSEDEQPWTGIASIQKYLDRRLTAGDEEKVYVTYHWPGTHQPFVLDVNGREAVRAVGFPEQLYGQFYVIGEYLQQMKDYHIYDSSTVIITADHGNYAYPHAVFLIKPASQRQEEMTVSHAPVTQSDFMPTIAELAGLESGQFGRSIFEIPEDEERERCSSVRWLDPDLPPISGKSANAMKEYCYTGDVETLHQMVENEDFISVPMKYSFY